MEEKKDEEEMEEEEREKEEGEDAAVDNNGDANKDNDPYLHRS